MEGRFACARAHVSCSESICAKRGQRKYSLHQADRNLAVPYRSTTNKAICIQESQHRYNAIMPVQTILLAADD